jgi:hypothetical protein
MCILGRDNVAYSLALLANFIGLILSIWLGAYIVTRGRGSWIAWSSGLTLWSLAGLFANILLFIFSSPTPISQPIWLRVLFPIWPLETDTNITHWTQGWAAGLGLLFWFQTTVLIIPGKMAVWRRVSLLVAYALGILSLALQIFTPQLFVVGTNDPLLVDNQSFKSIYSIYASFFLLLSVLSVVNAVKAKRLSTSLMAKKQINMLIAASLMSSLATLLSIVGAIPGLSIRVFWVSSLLVVAVGFFGFGVTRYSAVLGQRILRRDLAFSAIATGLVVLLYMGMFVWLITAYNLPEGIVIFLIPMVILSHSLTEEVRQVLERLIYDQRIRVLRNSLRDLSRLAVEQADLGAVLSRSLETICLTMRATYGVILIFDQEEACPTGSFRWHDGNQPLLRKDFEADDTRHIDPGSLPEPFLETTLLVPLYASQEQIGALLLGRPENGIHYSREDLLLLQGSIDSLTDLIIKNRRINEYLDQVAQLPLQQTAPIVELIPAAWVEDALQNICDYAYLGDSPLVNLQQVAALQKGASVTHLDLGKAVYQVLFEAVEKLRPQAALPSGPVPREWFPYLILHDAYFEGLPNRDITLKLYISEGTFHRTRRSALRSVTRVLGELESTVNQPAQSSN